MKKLSKQLDEIQKKRETRERMDGEWQRVLDRAVGMGRAIGDDKIELLSRVLQKAVADYNGVHELKNPMSVTCSRFGKNGEVPGCTVSVNKAKHGSIYCVTWSSRVFNNPRKTARMFASGVIGVIKSFDRRESL